MEQRKEMIAILNYQDKDKQIVALEKSLENDKDRKELLEMAKIVKKSQVASVELEKKAAELTEEFNKIKASFEDNNTKSNIVLTREVENASEQDLKNYEIISEKLMSNFAILEKKMIAVAEKVSVVLQDFDKARKQHEEAKAKHAACKAVYEKKYNEALPQIEKLKAELSVLEKAVEEKVIKAYKQKKNDKIYPVFVPLENKSCGGCRMELSSSIVDTIKQGKIKTCEHCRRLIYNN